MESAVLAVYDCNDMMSCSCCIPSKIRAKNSIYSSMAVCKLRVMAALPLQDGDSDGDGDGVALSGSYKFSILEASAMESRSKRYGDVGHLLPINTTSKFVQGTQLMRSAAEGGGFILSPVLPVPYRFNTPVRSCAAQAVLNYPAGASWV
jgi:hypothetical protein